MTIIRQPGFGRSKSISRRTTIRVARTACILVTPSFQKIGAICGDVIKMEKECNRKSCTQKDIGINIVFYRFVRIARVNRCVFGKKNFWKKLRLTHVLLKRIFERNSYIYWDICSLLLSSSSRRTRVSKRMITGGGGGGWYGRGRRPR